jgi:hypothetical protein
VRWDRMRKSLTIDYTRQSKSNLKDAGARYLFRPERKPGTSMGVEALY